MEETVLGASEAKIAIARRSLLDVLGKTAAYAKEHSDKRVLAGVCEFSSPCPPREVSRPEPASPARPGVSHRGLTGWPEETRSFHCTSCSTGLPSLAPPVM